MRLFLRDEGEVLFDLRNVWVDVLLIGYSTDTAAEHRSKESDEGYGHYIYIYIYT